MVTMIIFDEEISILKGIVKSKNKILEKAFNYWVYDLEGYSLNPDVEKAKEIIMDCPEGEGEIIKVTDSLTESIEGRIY